MTSDAGTRTVSPREARIGHVARMAAQEVVGHAAADPVELDALPDRARTGQDAGHVLRQHLRGQHLQLHRHGQPVLRPRRVRIRRNTSPARNTSVRPGAGGRKVGQTFGIGFVGPCEPELVQLLLLCGVSDL